MKNFRTLNGLQTYIKKNGIPDIFKLNGNLYQIDYYDMVGENLQFISIDDNSIIEMFNDNRYKSLKDTYLEKVDSIDSLRRDINYYYTKQKSFDDITQRFKTNYIYKI